jgi:CubicO group peptidase (beta-lactamase class C family)
MSKKELFFGSLALGSVLALFHTLFVRTQDKKSASWLRSFDNVDKYIEQQMQRLKIPGASLAIVEGDQIVHRQGFGLARPGGEVPTSLTPFFIGSLTKSITALAIMQLVEAGKVELDAPIQRYLPWFQVADPDASARMSVRHLLNQTSGFSTVASNVILANFDNRPDAIERQVRALSTTKLHHRVGEVVEYCNLNYNILGLIIEVTSGEDYAGYIRGHIFEPLGMNHTYTSKAAARQDGLARGHRHWFGFPVPSPDLPVPLGSLPSGQLISCTEDMAHYLIAHLNGGQYGQAQVLSSTGIDQLHCGEKEYLAFGKSVGSYAMGWFDVLIGKTRVLTHGGNVPDFSAFMALIPEQKKGIVLLLNADPYGLPIITEEIGSNLSAILTGQQPQPIKLDFIQWIFRLLPLIPLLQAVSVLSTLRKLRQWQQDPLNRPGGISVYGHHILTPLIPHLSLAATLAYLKSSGLIGFIDLFMPDLGWIARISGWFAIIWFSLRSGLFLQALRKNRP